MTASVSFTSSAPIHPKGVIIIPKLSSKRTRWSGNIALGAPQKAGGEVDNRSLQCPGFVSDFLSIEVYWGKLKVSKADMRG